MATKERTVISEELARNAEYRLTCNTATTGFKHVTYVLRRLRAKGGSKLVESAWVRSFDDFDEALVHAEAVGLKIKTTKVEKVAA